MTPKEAIDFINNEVQIDVRLCTEEKVGRTIEVFNLATKALEKQIPKKPEYEAWGYADGVLVYDYAKCPVCGHDFEDGVNDWGCAYCQDCGCSLDWSDTE